MSFRSQISKVYCLFCFVSCHCCFVCLFYSRAIGSSWHLPVICDLSRFFLLSCSVTQHPKQTRHWEPREGQRENSPNQAGDWCEKHLRMRFPKWHSSGRIPLDYLKWEMHAVEYNCQSTNKLSQENGFIHVRRKISSLLDSVCGIFLRKWYSSMSDTC